MPRKLALRAAITAIIASGITVLFCWGSAWMLGGSYGGIRQVDNIHLDTHSATVIGAGDRWVTYLWWHPYETPPPGHNFTAHGTVVVPGWSRLRTWDRPVPSPDKPGESRTELAYGWPLRSMSVTMSELGAKKSHIYEGFKYQDTLSDRLLPTVLPTRILWAGFAVDTAIAAGPLAIVWASLIWLRRSRRCRHGRCPTCGYDLKGQPASGCPECGSQRRSTTAVESAVL